MAEYLSKDEILTYLKPLTNTPAINIKIHIQGMPAADVQPVDRWISVKDRLPEVGKVVIVCDKQGGVGAMELLSNGQWYHRGMAWSAEWILYWQPLPEPPEAMKG